MNRESSVVICVHGTFSAPAGEESPGWYDPDGQFIDQLPLAEQGSKKLKRSSLTLETHRPGQPAQFCFLSGRS